MLCTTLLTSGLLILIYLSQVAINANQSFLATMPQQIHLSLGKSHSEMVITWTTYKLVESMVLYGEGESNLLLTQRGFVTTFIDNGQRIHYIHRVMLSNLKPFTVYYYQCSNGPLSEARSFRTLSDASNWSPRMIVFGDLGLQNGVTIPYLKKEVDSGTADLLFHNGDFAYDLENDLSHRGDQFMRLMEPAISRVAYQTSPGNHETYTTENLANYLHRFSMFDMTTRSLANQTIAKSDHYYAFYLGPALLISLNNEVYDRGQMYSNGEAIPPDVLKQQERWLVKVLEEANQPEVRAAHPWIIALGHQPMYCHSNFLEEEGCQSEAKQIRHHLEEILYRYGVDLAIWAHMHNYERQLPVYQHRVRVSNRAEPYRNPAAPVHIVSGSAGCNPRLDSNFLQPRPSWNAVRSATYGYGVLNIVNETNLIWQQRGIRDVGHRNESLYVVDQFELIQEVHGRRV